MHNIDALAARALPIERHRARDLSPAEFNRNFVAAGRPVVVEMAVANWPALQKWTPEFFRHRFAGKQVNVSFNARMGMEAFVDAMLASTADQPGPYLFRVFVCPHMPELYPDVLPMNPYSFPGRYASSLMPARWRRPDGYTKLLMGGAGSGFPIVHFDGENAHATITQVYGEKVFTLFPPTDSAGLYPKADTPNHSQIQDVRHVDLQRFPLFTQTTPRQTTLRAGDMIFVPCGWWHAANVDGLSISIGQNMLDASNWSRFAALVCAPGTGSPAWKRTLKRAWLHGLGAMFDVREYLFPPNHPRPHNPLARWDPMFQDEIRPWQTWPTSDWARYD